MITSICLNPCFDKTVELDSLTLGEVNRINTGRQDVGGKGINVAVVARRLGLEARCIGCAGVDGADKVCAALDNESIPHQFIRVQGAVRTNMKLICGNINGVTEVNEPGAAISEENLRAFYALAKEMAADSEYMVFTGSLPPGCPCGVYRDLIGAMGDVRCILDVGGEELSLGVQSRPWLIKPNLPELESTVRMELRTMRSIRDAARGLMQRGAQHVVVSMGSLGAMYVDMDTALFAPSLRVPVRSTVGAGDAMIGGLLFGLHEEGSLTKAFRYGVAAGAASVMTEGTQLIVASDFDRLLSQVRVQEV